MDTNSTAPDLDFRRFFELRDPVAKSALRLEMTDDSATTLELWELVRQRQKTSTSNTASTPQGKVSS